jgi:hypothetical protein
MGDISREMINEKNRLKKAGKLDRMFDKDDTWGGAMHAGRHCTVYDLLARDQPSQCHASYL